MLDEHSFVVTYQAWRGEPRGKRKKDEAVAGKGDCVDCGQCIAVCPTGIDIRDGQQLECINFGLCVDACNTVMAKVGLPTGLIRYDTVLNQARRAARLPAVYRLIRPRTAIYAVLLAAIGALMVYGLATRSTHDVTVQRDRSPLFVTLSDGAIRNGYTVKILNKLRQERSYMLTVFGIGAPHLQVTGQGEGEYVHFEAAPDSVATYKVYIAVPRAELKAESVPITFVLTDLAGGKAATHKSVFLGPKP